MHFSGASHHKGGPMHYAFGYCELAEAIGADEIELVEAVTSGRLYPLSLVHLAAARRHGLRFLEDPSAEAREVLDRYAKTSESATKRVTMRADREPTSGLDVLWAICRDDVAEAAGVYPRKVMNAVRAGQLDLVDVDSVIDWVVPRLPSDVSAALALDKRPGSAVGS